MSKRIRSPLVCCLFILGSAGLAWGYQAGLSQSNQQLSVLIGKSVVLTSPEPLGRVSVTDPEIASAVIVTETQLLIHGLRPGSITLLLWNQHDELQSFDLEVQFDIAGLRETLGQTFPEEDIEVIQSGESLVLKGIVGSTVTVEQAAALAGTFSPNVVNMLGIRENRDVILLQVKIAEVDRGALSELGVSIFAPGLGNTIGSTSTQQFGSLGASSGQIPDRVPTPPQGNPQVGRIGQSLENYPSVFGLTDLMNLFLFRPDLNLGAVVRALNQRSLLEILAEPNVMALNGKQASFLAGGEFPFPVVQGGTNNAVTIEFREFGVRVDFTPQVLDDGMIRLKVAPEVSALDFANALTVSGFVIPALSSRKAETEVELKSGQSFAIAGLIDNRTIEIASKIPGLGDIPLLGHLFRSRSTERTNTELLVMVTPLLVRPSDGPAGIQQIDFPSEFLNRQEFDTKIQKKAKPTSSPPKPR